jgi:hypothetical protein
MLNIIKQSGDPLYAKDINDIVTAINAKPDSIEGVDLTEYLKSVDAANTYLTPSAAVNNFQLKGNYLTDVYWSTIQNKPSFFDGDYTSLVNKPTLFSGNYSDLAGKPSIPSITGLASETFVNSSISALNSVYKPIGYIPTWNEILNKPTLFDGNYNSLSNRPELFSGDYNSLINKPVIPNITGLATENYVDSQIAVILDSAPELLNTLAELSTSLGDDPNFATTVTNWLSLKANSADVFTKTEINAKGYLTGVTYNDVTDKPTLFSGNYNDLTNRPTLFDGNYNSLSNKPAAISGTGFVKVVGTTLSYDNNTYQTTTATTTALNLKANLASPTFTGTVTLPTGTVGVTQTAGNSSTALATTAFATGAITTATANLISNSSDTFGSKVLQIVSLSAAEYAALATKVATTLYIVN